MASDEQDVVVPCLISSHNLCSSSAFWSMLSIAPSLEGWMSPHVSRLEKVRENLAEDSGILADNPPPANAAAAQAIHELEQVLGPQPSTSTSLEKPPKNHQGRTQL